jgi:multidrug transporter EmrE-like cation transporter
MPDATIVFLLMALLFDGAAIAFLEHSQGLAKRLSVFALVVCYSLSLTCLTLAFNLNGLAMWLIYAAWAVVGIAVTAAVGHFWKPDVPWNGKEVGPVGTIARVGLGLGLVGSVVQGQLSTHLAPAPWILGAIGFPAIALAWHAWRIHDRPAPFRDTSTLGVVLSIGLPVVLYLTWWYAPAFSATSDATLIFLGFSMMLAALRSYGGCDMLATSNWLLRRRDQVACALFTPIDSLEWHNACA